MDLSKLSFFITAVEAGSLSAAAKRVGAQVSTISRALAELEETLKTTLLTRTGRGVRLTPAGERFLPHAKNILQEMSIAAAEARGETLPRLARLKISAPITFSMQLLPSCIVALLKKYPNLSIEAHADVRRVSLLEEDYDAAIRLGVIQDDSLIVQPLGAFSLALCALPALAAKIRSVEDLRSKQFVMVSGTPPRFSLLYKKREHPIQKRGHCRVSNFLEAAEIASQMPLLALLPADTALPFLKSGRLRLVLPSFITPKVNVSIVQPPQTRGATTIKELGVLLSAEMQRVDRELQEQRREGRERR